jgi:hypothetical protein
MDMLANHIRIGGRAFPPALSLIEWFRGIALLTFLFARGKCDLLNHGASRLRKQVLPGYGTVAGTTQSFRCGQEMVHSTNRQIATECGK